MFTIGCFCAGVANKIVIRVMLVSFGDKLRSAREEKHIRMRPHLKHDDGKSK